MKVMAGKKYNRGIYVCNKYCILVQEDSTCFDGRNGRRSDPETVRHLPKARVHV